MIVRWNETTQAVENLEETLRRTKERFCRDGFVSPWPVADTCTNANDDRVPTLQSSADLKDPQEKSPSAHVPVQHDSRCADRMVDKSEPVRAMQTVYRGASNGCLICSKPTITRSGICKACRTIQCKDCSKTFVWKDIQTNLCSGCQAKRASEMKRYALQIGVL